MMPNNTDSMSHKTSTVSAQLVQFPGGNKPNNTSKSFSFDNGSTGLLYNQERQKIHHPLNKSVDFIPSSVTQNTALEI